MKMRKKPLLSFKKRPPVFLIFADLDGTFTPMNLHGKIDFLNVIKEITETGVQVKFIPVSGRPAGYVLRLLHEVRDMIDLEGMNIHGVCDFGAAEQGAVIVDSSRSYGPRYMGRPENVGLKAEIAKIMAQNPYAKIISDEPDKLYTCSIHIKNEAKEDMSEADQSKIYHSVRDDIVKVFGEGTLSIAMSHNCMEVMTKDISKSGAMHFLIRNYATKYNVVGFLYAGDAENDRVAMEFVSKYAEIRGINAHNFTPGNAQDAISSEKIEPWKRRSRLFTRHFVEKSEPTLFKGITELIRKKIRENRLCGVGVEVWETRDDPDLMHRKRFFRKSAFPTGSSLRKSRSLNDLQSIRANEFPNQKHEKK